MSIFTRICAAIALAVLIFPPHAAGAADKWVTPGFAAGWKNYGNGYRQVSAVKSGAVVTVSGLAAKPGGGKWGHVATLPSDMRPKQRLVFNVSTHDRTARVDVLPNGQIHFVTGNTGYKWVSLDGISFSTAKSNPVKLASGWANYGQGYAGINTVLAGDTVMVGGLVKPGEGNVIATLPANLRPAKRLVFNLNSDDKTSRVDVFPDGRIVWVYRAPARGWVSLNGVTFSRKPGAALSLVNGWRKHRDSSFASANVMRKGNRVSVSGLTEGGKWGHIATLPKGMCPKSRLIFNLNNHDRASRVDVISDCRIIWVAGGKSHGWINLDGIAFNIGKPGGAQTASKPAPPAKSAPPAKAVFLPWVRVPGGATDIGVGANGGVWIVGENRKGAGNDIWRYAGRNKWQSMPGGAVRIAVDPAGNAWIVDRNRKIHRWDGGTWKTVAGGANDIAIGANGAVWAIGADKRSGGFTIWRYSGNNKWKNVPGAGTRIAVDPKGNAWIVNAQKQILRYDGRKWHLMPGAATDIGIGAEGAVWVVGTDSAPYRWDGKIWVKYVGGIANISVGPKGYPWATNAGKAIWADKRSPGYTKVPKPVVTVKKASPNKTKLIADAKKSFGGLGGVAGSVKTQINRLINTANHLLVEEGELLKADVKVLNQDATIVIYRPIANQPRVNFALLTKPGESLKVSNFISPAGGTPADDLQLANAAYIFVPKGNAQNINTSQLPSSVRLLVEKARTGPVEMLAGHNIFSTINTRDGGPTANLLKLVGVSLGDLKVHIGYGQRVNNDPFKAVRLTREGDWTKPFHMANTVFNNATLDLSKWGNVKRLRGWGTARLHNKPYFLFVQKTGSAGPYPTAAAVDASSISLKDYKNLSLIFAETVFGSVGAAQQVFKGIDNVPLDKVRIENPRYRAGGALDADNNPIFDNVLLMAASPADTLPDAKKTQGPIILAHGNARVFGFNAGSVDGWVTTNKGMDIQTRVNLPKWGKMSLGTFAFDLSRGASKTSYDMYLRGHASVGSGPVKFSENVEIKANRTGFRFNFGQNCPHRPVGVSASVNGHEIGKGSGFSLSATGNPMTCVADIGAAIVNAAGTVANVSQQAYDESRKKVEQELKNISNQAMKAANFVANKISSWVGKKKKSKPRKPSAQELVNLSCSRGVYPPYVLWEDECHFNHVDKDNRNANVRQSSDKPAKWAQCAYPNTVKRAENYVAEAKKNGGSLRFTVDEPILGKWIPYGSVVSLDTFQKHLKQTKELLKERCIDQDYMARNVRNRQHYDRAQTKVQKNPWWEVEFKKPVHIRTITVFSPGQKANELDGLIVAMSDSVSGDDLMVDTSSAVKRYKLGAAAMAVVNPITEIKKISAGSIQAQIPPTTRYLRIYRPGTGSVALGEVQVFGYGGVVYTR